MFPKKVKQQNKGRKCPKLTKEKACSTLPECSKFNEKLMILMNLHVIRNWEFIFTGSKRNRMNIRRRSKDDLPLNGNYNNDGELNVLMNIILNNTIFLNCIVWPILKISDSKDSHRFLRVNFV